MQVFAPIHIGNQSLTFSNITVGNVISVARLPDGKHELKITEFLKAVLNDSTKPYQLYAQQRHYLMMKYQEAQKESFNFNIDFEKYEKNGPWLETIEVNGYQFRQLNGFECEALEMYAKDYLDWLFGAISLQISGPNIPLIPPCTDQKFAFNIIQNRVPLIHGQDVEDFEKIINGYSLANDQLNNLIDLSFDNEGIVCLEQGGTEDAPCRFRPLSTIPSGLKNLLGGLSKQSGSSD